MNLPERLITFLDGLTWARILKIALIIAIIAGARTFILVPRRYAARTSVLLSTEPDILSVIAKDGLGSGVGGGGGGGLAAALAGGNPQQDLLINILGSRDVQARLVKEFGLTERWGVSEQDACEKLGAMTSIKKMSMIGVSVTVLCAGPTRLQEWFGLRSAFSTAEAKQTAADLANAYRDKADDYIKEKSVEMAGTTSAFVQEQIEKYEAELRKTQDRLLTLQTKYAMVDMQTMAQNIASETQYVMQAYAKAIADSVAALHSLEAARAQVSAEEALVIADEMRQRNPVIAKLESQHADLQLEYDADLARGKSASHPDMRLKKERMAGINRQLKGIQQQVLSQVSRASNPARTAAITNMVNLQIQLAGAEAQKAQYGAMLKAVQNRTAKFPAVMRDYIALAGQRDLYTKLITTLTERKELASMAEKRQTAAKFVVLDVAVPPERKAGPSSVMNAALFFILTCGILGIGWAWRKGLILVG